MIISFRFPVSSFSFSHFPFHHIHFTFPIISIYHIYHRQFYWATHSILQFISLSTAYKSIQEENNKYSREKKGSTRKKNAYYVILTYLHQFNLPLSVFPRIRFMFTTTHKCFTSLNQILDTKPYGLDLSS